MTTTTSEGWAPLTRLDKAEHFLALAVEKAHGNPGRLTAWSCCVGRGIAFANWARCSSRRSTPRRTTDDRPTPTPTPKTIGGTAKTPSLPANSTRTASSGRGSMPSNAATNPPPSSGASSPSRNRASTPSSSTSGSREHRLCKQLIRIDERTSSELEWRFYDTAKWMQNEYDSTLGPALNWRIAREPREREATQ